MGADSWKSTLYSYMLFMNSVTRLYVIADWKTNPLYLEWVYDGWSLFAFLTMENYL